MSGSGISWVICKSAPRSRQITTPAPHQSGRPTRRQAHKLVITVAKLLLYLYNPDKYQYQQNRIEWCFDEWSITMHAGRAHYACWRRCGLPYQYHIQMKLSRSRALDALKTHRRKMPNLLRQASSIICRNCGTRHKKVAHTRLTSVGFRSCSRFLAVSLQVT